MEQAVELVHQAKKAQGAQKASIFEKLLTLIRGIKAAPSLLEEVLPLVLDLRQDAEARPFIAQFIEEVCRRRPNLIPAAAPTIRALSYNENEPQTLIKTIKCVSALFKRTLALVCSEESEVDDDESSEAWHQIHEAATTLRAHTNHSDASVRHTAVMLLQVLALALTPTEDAEEGEGGGRGGAGWTLQHVPPCHQVLDYTDLKKEGESCLASLLALLDPARAAPLPMLLLTINALGRLARSRPQLLGEIEPALEKLRTSPPNLPGGGRDWQGASLKFTLKSTFLALLKLPACSAYAAVLMERLKSLGAHTQAEAARRVMQKEQAKERKGAQDPRLVGDQEGKSSKRHRSNQSLPLIAPERIPKDKPLEEWDPELVSDLVMAAMVNYPPALPPHLIDVAETPLSMWPERLAYPSLHAKQPRDEGQKEEEGEGAEGAEDTMTSADSIRKKALLAAKPLKRDLVKSLATEALLRLLHGDGTGWQAKGVVVARLWAGSEAVGVELEDDLIKYVLGSYSERHGLAIQYLYELYALEKGRAAFQPAKPRYNKALQTLLRGLVDVDDSRYLTSVLAEAPVVDAESTTLVSELCEREDKRQVGLSCLRALIVHQPSWRTQCLSRLLHHTAAENESIRSPAVRLVANKLFPKPFLVASIQRFAVANLRRACQVEVDQEEGLEEEKKKEEKEGDKMETDGGEREKTEGADGGVVRHLMHLFLALCAQRHALLNDLLQTYVQSPQHVRSAIHSSITDMIRAIGPESPQLLEILNDSPPGAELLILAFVRTLTDSGGPHHKLNMAIKGMYSRTSDARCMIYICASLPRAEVESLLPRLVALPPVGVKAALQRLLHSRPPPLKPQELILALHKITPTKELSMKKVAEAIDACFNDKAIFTTQVLAVVLQQLLDQNPLPTLYMRTVLLSLKLSPGLTDFVIDVILHRLILKQVWLLPTLWEGFIKCCRTTLPRSLRVLVQLPRNRLEDAVAKSPDLAPPLENYFRQQQAQGFKGPSLAALGSLGSRPDRD